MHMYWWKMYICTCVCTVHVAWTFSIAVTIFNCKPPFCPQGWPRLTWFVTEHLPKASKEWSPPQRPQPDAPAYIEVSWQSQHVQLNVCTCTCTCMTVLNHPWDVLHVHVHVCISFKWWLFLVFCIVAYAIYSTPVHVHVCACALYMCMHCTMYSSSSFPFLFLPPSPSPVPLSPFPHMYMYMYLLLTPLVLFSEGWLCSGCGCVSLRTPHTLPVSHHCMPVQGGWVDRTTCTYMYIHVYVTCKFVGSCLATKIFISWSWSGRGGHGVARMSTRATTANKIHVVTWP